MNTRTPLSSEQSGIWFTEEAGVAGTAYHLPLEIEFSGELDTNGLRVACATVVARHPILASAVDVQYGVPYLVGTPPPQLSRIDVSGAPDPETARNEALVTQTALPFDRSTGPLTRFTLIRVSAVRHVLLVVAHHLVFDGTSKEIFVSELATAYGAMRSGRPGGPRVGAAISPAAADPDEAGARHYWHDRWQAPDPVLLPGSGPAGPDVPESMRFDADAELGAALERGAEKFAVTRFELLLTGLRAVLLRYGNDRATVAVDLGTRTAATHSQIGMYVNQLPVDGPLDADHSFQTALEATRDELRSLYPVRRFPLSRAVPGLPVGLALAPVSISYRRQGPEPQWPAPLQVTVGWMPFNQAARRDLHVQIVDGPAGLGVSLQYRTGTLGRAGAEQIAGHLITLLRAGLENPGSRLADLPLLTPAEYQQVVEDWNRTVTPYPQTGIDQLIAAQAGRTPQAIAVESDGPDQARLSYAELNARANQLAHLLRQEGARPGTVVAVLGRRSADLVVGLLAVLKSGAAYLPLDPDQPDARLGFMLADAGVELVLAASRSAPRLAASGVPVRLVLLEQIPAGQPATDPEPLAGPDDPAYVIYTSGSTGSPKGVPNSHRGLSNRLDWMQRRFALDGSDAVLQKTPIGFDVSVWELFWPLLAGARLVMAGPDGHRDPRYLRDVITSRQITTVHFVPSMLTVFLEEPDVEGCTSLRRTICSGEELTPALAGRFLARVPGELHNLYGPTEAAIDVSAWQCTPALVAGADRLPIGRPIQNMRLYVVDRWGNPVPVGIAGELLIGGPGVALGYLNRPELTRERFEPDPHGPPGSTRYRTGDRARFRPDGNLEYLGRIDRQLKLRGNRIEPGEIEAVLTAHPAVAQAAVLVTGPADDRRLVAYLVAVPGAAEPELPELREHVSARLPDYMVPASFQLLAHPPLTANGKLDHAALAVQPAAVDPDPHMRPVPVPDAGEDQLVAQISAIWAEVLGVDAIRVDDDLFELGGHSLTITQIAARMRRRLHIDLPLHIFYDGPTIGDVVAASRRTTQSRAGDAG